MHGKSLAWLAPTLLLGSLGLAIAAPLDLQLSAQKQSCTAKCHERAPGGKRVATCIAKCEQKRAAKAAGRRY